MVTTQIIVNDISLNFVKETLNVKETLDAFQDSFSLPGSSYPFLIINDELANQALGVIELGSRFLKKEVECVIRFRESVYKGVLSQKKVLSTGYRMCDIRFTGDLLDILTKPVKDILPTIKLDPAAGDYDENYLAAYDQSLWTAHSADLYGKIWPQVKYQVPEIKYPTIDEDNLNQYSGNINNKTGVTQLTLNEYNILTSTTAEIVNRSVLQPKIYLLSVLEYIMDSIGWSFSGNFVNNTAIKSALIDIGTYNSFKIDRPAPAVAYDMQAIPFANAIIGSPSGLFVPYPGISQDFTIDTVGDYKITYAVLTSPQTSPAPSSDYHGVVLMKGSQQIDAVYFDYAVDIQDAFDLEITASDVNDTYTLVYIHRYQVSPSLLTLNISIDLDLPEFIAYHPTINLDRYVPDWRVSDYFTFLKNCFNVKFTVNNDSKHLTVSFRNDLINYNDVKRLPIDVAISPPEYSEQPNYILKHADDIFDTMFIDSRTNIINGSPTLGTKEIATGIKTIEGTLSIYTDEYVDASGIGIVFYNPVTDGITNETYGLSLLITGEKGLYNRLWKAWLFSRLNAYTVTIEGYFTTYDLSHFSDSEKVFIDDQCYLVKSIESKELESGSFESKIELETISF